MTSALTPKLAVKYLRELSNDLDAVAIFDSRGEFVAGDSQLSADGGELLTATDAPRLDVTFASSKVFMSRSTAFAIVATTSRFALPALVHYDLRTVLGDLGERQGT